MKPKKSNTILYVLIAILFIACVYTAYAFSQYWLAPRTIETQHFLYAEVITDKNLTEMEVLGYTDEKIVKYVIIAEGGIDFYRLNPGMNFTRQLELKNIWSKPVELKFTPSGDVGKWLTIEAPQELAPKQTILANLTVHVPLEAYANKFRGNLTVRLIPKA